MIGPFTITRDGYFVFPNSKISLLSFAFLTLFSTIAYFVGANYAMVYSWVLISVIVAFLYARFRFGFTILKSDFAGYFIAWIAGFSAATAVRLLGEFVPIYDWLPVLTAMVVGISAFLLFLPSKEQMLRIVSRKYSTIFWMDFTIQNLMPVVYMWNIHFLYIEHVEPKTLYIIIIWYAVTTLGCVLPTIQWLNAQTLGTLLVSTVFEVFRTINLIIILFDFNLRVVDGIMPLMVIVPWLGVIAIETHISESTRNRLHTTTADTLIPIFTIAIVWLLMILRKGVFQNSFSLYSVVKIDLVNWVLILIVLILIAARVWIMRSTISRFVQTMETELSVDRLTGAYNRSSFAATKPKNGWLFLVDIDRFRDINELRGHEVGDRLLSRLAGRLKEAFAGLSDVYRISSDEFVMIVDERVTRLERLGTQALRAGQDEEVPECTVSVAVVNIREDAEIIAQSIAAHRALQLSKERKGAGLLHFPAQIFKDLMESEKNKVSCNRFGNPNPWLVPELVYFPVVETGSGDERVAMFESALRIESDSLEDMGQVGIWNRIEYEGSFIFVSDNIFSKWIKDARYLMDNDKPRLTSLYLPLEVLQREEFRSNFEKRISEAGNLASYLVLFIPEEALKDEELQIFNFLQMISSMGVQIGIKDFGYGEAVISQLAKSPISLLQVSSELTSTTDGESLKIVTDTLHEMCDELGIDLIFVAKNRYKAEVLKSFGVKYLSYTHSKPLVNAQQMWDEEFVDDLVGRTSYIANE